MAEPEPAPAAPDVGVQVTKDKDKFQSCVVLKASIHCEGCKKKVKKLLTQVQGVNSVDVDTKLQKVTVFGTAHPDALLYKLLKSGKNAELWPQIPPPPQYSNKQSKVVQPQQEPKPTSQNVPKVQIGVVKEKNQEIIVEDQTKSSILKGKKKVDSEETKSTTKGKGKEIDSKGEIVLEEEQTKSKVEDCTKSNDGIIGGGGSGGESSSYSTKSGSGGKKKKKKGQNGNNNINNGSGTQGPAAPVVEEQEPPVVREEDNYESSPPVRTNQYQPRHHQNLPRHHFYTPPPPLQQYGVSYNTAYPTSSYTASYYPEQPPPSFAYAYAGPPPPPLDQEQPRQPLDSFEMFSDENPNGCIIM